MPPARFFFWTQIMQVYPKKGCQMTADMKQTGTTVTFLAATPGRTTMAPTFCSWPYTTTKKAIIINLNHTNSVKNTLNWSVCLHFYNCVLCVECFANIRWVVNTCLTRCAFFLKQITFQHNIWVLPRLPNTNIAQKKLPTRTNHDSKQRMCKRFRRV